MKSNHRLQLSGLKKSLLLPLAALVSLVGFAVPSHGALLLYEGFDYTGGTTVGPNPSSGTMNGGTGWSVNQRWFDNNPTDANAYTVASPSLSYGSLTTSGNALSQASDSIGAARNFNNTSTSLADGTYYVSFLISFSGNSPSMANMYGGLQLGSAYFGIANLNGGTTTERNFVLSNSYGNGTDGTTRVHTGVTLSLNTTYLLVAKVTFSASGQDSYSLWINPTTGSEASAGAAQAFNNTTNSTSIAQASFYTSSTAFGMTVDELRIGTTWEDVTPGLPIPEPGIYAMLAAQGALLAIWGKRRKWALR